MRCRRCTDSSASLVTGRWVPARAQEISHAARTSRSWVYFGYRVAGCSKMTYKGRFVPGEELQPDGSWLRFTSCQHSTPRPRLGWSSKPQALRSMRPLCRNSCSQVRPIDNPLDSRCARFNEFKRLVDKRLYTAPITQQADVPWVLLRSKSQDKCLVHYLGLNVHAGALSRQLPSDSRGRARESK